mgnify:FL=1
MNIMSIGPTRILIDWGGTLVRDELLFDTIALKSGANNPTYDGPHSWDSIRSIGNQNFFQTLEKSFFKNATFYPNALNANTRQTDNNFN